jgi:hypothetical protein
MKPRYPPAGVRNSSLATDIDPAWLSGDAAGNCSPYEPTWEGRVPR